MANPTAMFHAIVHCLVQKVLDMEAQSHTPITDNMKSWSPNTGTELTIVVHFSVGVAV